VACRSVGVRCTPTTVFIPEAVRGVQEGTLVDVSMGPNRKPGG
jgi:hypothetical protein